MTMVSASSCSERMAVLTEKLRLYKPPRCSNDSDDDERGPKPDGNLGKVASQRAECVEPANPTDKRPERRVGPKRSAVLICLFEGDDGELRVFLTKRSSRLSTFSGHVALPGGRCDESDADDAATATREAMEEIGLDPSLVKVVTLLQPFLAKRVYKVIPVIGILCDKDAYKPTLNPDEVDEIFDVPLEMFLKNENRRSEEREWLGMKYLLHFFEYDTGCNKHVIWGLTASMLIKAASIVFQSPPPFLEQYPDFKVPKVVDEIPVIP